MYLLVTDYTAALVYSGCGASAAVYLMSLDTVLTQLEAAGDTNLSHYR